MLESVGSTRQAVQATDANTHVLHGMACGRIVLPWGETTGHTHMLCLRLSHMEYGMVRTPPPMATTPATHAFWLSALQGSTGAQLPRHGAANRLRHCPTHGHSICGAKGTSPAPARAWRARRLLQRTSPAPPC